MKKFVLIVQYASGEIATLVDEPDLTKAINIFLDKLKVNYFDVDKGHPIPDIKGARIIPLMYETIYEKGEK